MKLAGTTVLVTGGAGFIGSHLVEGLLAENSEVYVLDNLSTGKSENLSACEKNKNFHFVFGDITNPQDIRKAMKGIDIVFHLATLGVRHSIKHPFENHRVNAEGTLSLLEEARRQNISRFIYCSSSEVYGTAQYVPMTEEHPTLPHTVYGASKLAGESYARAYYETYRLNTCVIRPFNTFGPRSHYEGEAGEMIPKSIVRALNGQPILIFGSGTQTRDFTYVEDTARGLLEAAKNSAMIGRTLNIGSNFEISIKDLAQKIINQIGHRLSKLEYVEGRPGDVMCLRADARKFKELTSWSPQVSFEEGLQRTLEWFKTSYKNPKELLKQETGMNWKP